MKFEPGNKLAKGGKRPGSGRPAKGELTARQIVQAILDKRASDIAHRYVMRSLARNGDRVLCHAIDKLLPDDYSVQPAAINISFIRFEDTAQLSAERLPITVLAEDEEGNKERSNGLASEIGKRQNGIKFHDF